MANKPGGIVGLVIGLVVVCGLAATPFYMGMLRSDSRALDAAVEGDIETVRRTVLAMDEGIAAISAMTASIKDPGQLPEEELKRLTRAEPEDVFDRKLLADLRASAQLLIAVNDADTKRGTLILGKGTIEQKKLKAPRVIHDFKTAVKDQEQRMREAESRLNNLRSASRGASSAATHLGVNRIKGIYLLAKGRLKSNIAQFERMYASLLRRAAQDRVPALLELRRQEATIDAQVPQQRLAAIDDRLKGTQAGLAAVQAAMKQLDSVIKGKQEQLADLEKSSAEAQQALAEMGGQRLAFNEYSSRYLELSAQSRKAEAEATALRYGTLRDATRVESLEAEPTPPSYEGGAATPGLDKLTFQFDQLKDQQTVLETMVKELEGQRGALTELEQSLDTQREEVAKKIEQQAGEVTGWLTQADTHEEKSLKAEEDAIKTLKEAARAAKDAVKAAKDLSNAARQDAGSGGAVDERLQRVSQDSDAEASMHCLAAECAYAGALLRAEHIAAIRDRAQIADQLAQATGTETAAPSDDLDKIRTEAANDLADALKSYDQAAIQVGKINIKAGSVSVSGKNFVWQVQMGQAAVHLLLAALHAEDADKAVAEKALAYNLLKEAAEKREQSPLLTPAIDTLLYLQKSAQ